MSFLQKFFGKKTFNAADNVGTRYDTEDKATAAWNTQGMSVAEGNVVETHINTAEGMISKTITSKGYPYFCYRFSEQKLAEKAFASLPFIEKTKDSGQFISTKVLEYGCFATEQGDWEVLAWGADLDRQLFVDSLRVMKNHFGKEIGVREPKASAAPPAATKKSAKPNVDYVGTQTNGPNTYEVYRSASKEAALAYLQGRTVDKRLYYVVVETPEGNWGRDIQGVYKE